MIRVALATISVRVSNVWSNWLRLRRHAWLAALQGAKLVVFPEYCLTGFRSWWFGDAILYWELLEMVKRLARLLDVYVVLGLLEPPECATVPHCPAYNSAVLVGPDGNVILKHRKWEEPTLFCRGSKMSAADTPFGRVAIIVCGDLFNEDVRERVRELSVDYLIVPMDRSGTPGMDYDLTEEVEAMGDAVRDCGIKRAALIVNTHNHDGSHGFAIVLKPSGKPLEALEGEGMLVSDLP